MTDSFLQIFALFGGFAFKNVCRFSWDRNPVDSFPIRFSVLEQSSRYSSNSSSLQNPGSRYNCEISFEGEITGRGPKTMKLLSSALPFDGQGKLLIFWGGL
ncbi:MAG: hypothetical protein LUO89_09565 [Methanothrix sp.]|nr:hypothetical protein [Methanothrix sp.]